MIQQMHLTTRDIVLAKRKLETIHHNFSARGETDAIYDFARMLRQRISRVKTGREFTIAYNKAIGDMRDEKKVPEAWDKSTIGFINESMPFITKELFGLNFTEEVMKISLAQLSTVG